MNKGCCNLMSDFSGCFSLPAKLQSNIYLFFISKGRSFKAYEHFLSLHIAWCFTLVTQCCGTKYLISWELLHSDLGDLKFLLAIFHIQVCLWEMGGLCKYTVCHRSFWMIIQSGLETTLKILDSKCNLNLETKHSNMFSVSKQNKM